MKFTSVHPAGLPTPPPPMVLPPASLAINAATNLSCVARFLFRSPGYVDDQTTDQGKAWSKYLDGLLNEKDIDHLYWGMEEIIEKEKEEDQGLGRKVLLIISLKLPKGLAASNTLNTISAISPLDSYLLKPPGTTLSHFGLQNPRLGAARKNSVTICTTYNLSESLPAARVADSPQIWSYERAELKSRDESTRPGWVIGTCVGNWAVEAEEGQRDVTRRFMTLITWETKERREAWEASAQAKRLGDLWRERTTGEKEVWAAKLKLEMRTDSKFKLDKERYDKWLRDWEKEKARKMKDT